MTDKNNNREEMARWLAEEVLGWTNVDTLDIEGIAYRPDFFFTVWDKFHPMATKADSGITFQENEYGDMVCSFHVEKKFILEEGKDRYEAFYNAVKQAWEGK